MRQGLFIIVTGLVLLAPVVGQETTERGPKELAILKEHCPNGVTSITFSPDGKTLACGGTVDNRVLLWDLTTKQWKACPRSDGLWRARLQVAFSADGEVVAWGGDGGPGDQSQEFYLFDRKRGLLRTARWEDAGAVDAVASSPDGRTVAFGGIGSPMRLCDIVVGREKATFGGKKPGVTSLAFSPDGKSLASGEHGEIRLWEVATCCLRGTIRAGRSWVRSMAFHPNGRVLASGGDDGAVSLWNLGTGKLLRSLQSRGPGVSCVALSPDGGVLAAAVGARAQNAGRVRLLDTASGKELASLRGHVGLPTCVTFSPDGKLLASGGEDSTVRLWDVSAHTRGAGVRPAPKAPTSGSCGGRFRHKTSACHPKW